MKLQDIICTIKDIAASQPSVNQVLEGNVYQLNELKDIKYGVSVITQGQHKKQDDFIHYNFIIYYVDRLTEGATNRVNVQSTAIDTLGNIMANLDSLGIDFESGNYQTFTQKFEAQCAGAYVNATFIVPVDDCDGFSILDEYAKKQWTLEKIAEAGGVTTGQVQDMITSAITEETARTESTYLKEHQSLSGYATEQWVLNKNYTTSAATNTQITSAIDAETARTEATYLKTHQDISGKADKSYVDNELDAVREDISDLQGEVEGKASKSYVDNAIAAETARTENTYLKEHQSLSGYATESWVEDKNYTTSAATEQQISTAIAAETARTESTYLKEHQSLADYATTAITEQLELEKQDKLTAGTGITIDENNVISVSGGTGSGNVIELTQAEYNALTSYTENTIYVITDAPAVDLSIYQPISGMDIYYTSAQTENAYAKKTNPGANTGSLYFPYWNADGVITGKYSLAANFNSVSINGNPRYYFSYSTAFPSFYAPTAVGTQYQILQSNGSGAPVWSNIKMRFLTQAQYDALTPDSTTIYFIIG